MKIAIGGALGRMGHAVAAVAAADPALEIAGRFDRPGATGDGLSPREKAAAQAEVVIDFSTPEATIELAEALAGTGPRLVLGATGLSAEQKDRLAAAAKAGAIVYAGNYSLGLNMLIGLVRQAAAALPAEDWDIEVFEAHHKRKVDAPSGTALMLGQAAATGRGVDLDQVQRRARDGITNARPPGEIGFSVMRGGGIVGEHSVTFASEDEILSFAHSARDRSLFARGAVAAAKWVADKPPGLYDMQDVLGLRR
jgi:4-hydroxy-tetrahydrodipicolinate reductase